MKNWHWLWMAPASMATAASAWAADTLPSPAPTPRAVAPDAWMIPGGMRRDRQPDGNSVVFDAPAGLIVVDSGRHAWHRDAILDLARAQKKKVIAIVNTHWHLDHVSGNPALRAAYPDLRVYASDAIDGALTGFLAKSASDSTAYLEDSTIAADMRDDIRGDVSTIQAGQALKPDTVIAASGPVMLGGRELTMNLARDAVTAGDVWVYDDRGPAGRGRRSRDPAGSLPGHRLPGRLEVSVAASRSNELRGGHSRSRRPNEPRTVPALPGRVRRVHRLRELGPSAGGVCDALGGLDPVAAVAGAATSASWPWVSPTITSAC